MTTAPQVKLPNDIYTLISRVQALSDKQFQQFTWLRGTVQQHQVGDGIDIFFLSGNRKSIRCVADHNSVHKKGLGLLKKGADVDLAGKLVISPSDGRFEIVVEQIYSAGYKNPSKPVSDFITDLKSWFDQGTQGKILRTRGAVIDCKNGNKYTTFDLSDWSSRVRCIVWETTNPSFRQGIVDRAEISVAATLEIYDAQCRMQMNVKEVTQVATNSLINYREVIQQLQQKGLWPKRPKHPFPEAVQKIGLITSQGSMAWADFRVTYEREGGKAEVEESFALVQGPNAPAQIAANVNRFSQLRSVDVIVITRGGGKADDLSEVFDHPLIAEAICQSAIPVLTAIGHTADQTLADLVADAYENTPTGAAVRLAKVPTQQKRSGGILNTLGQFRR